MNLQEQLKELEKRHALLDAYLEGDMIPSLRTEFEQILAQDKTLEAELLAQYYLRQHLRHKAAEETVKNWRETPVNKATKIVPLSSYRKLRWFAAAAAVFTGVIVALWWFNRTPLSPIDTQIALTVSDTVKVRKIFSGTEQGAFPAGSDTIYIQRFILSVTADAKRPPQYNFRKEHLELWLSKPTQPKQIEMSTLSPSKGIYYLKIEGKTYEIRRDSSGLLQEKIFEK